jgi:hypothetical protein
MLFLFSDVTENDAPTQIRVGSHLRVPRLLHPAGEEGLSFMKVSAAASEATHGMQETTATGIAGTVYLCHPFLVHSAQPTEGKRRALWHSRLFFRESLSNSSAATEIIRSWRRQSCWGWGEKAGMNRKLLSILALR